MKIIPIKIKEEPVKILALKNSDKINHPKKAANIAHVLIIIAASFGENTFAQSFAAQKQYIQTQLSNIAK